MSDEPDAGGGSNPVTDPSGGSDTFTETRSWGGRVGSSIGGVAIGILLLVVAFPLLFWNEGRAVDRERTLDAGERAVRTVPADVVDRSLEGKLVHVSGPAVTTEKLTDPDFNVTVGALKLVRTVEMFQWQESSETRNNTTTHTYSKTWSASRIDSSSFRQPSGHTNPAMPYSERTVLPRAATLGAFTLGPDQLGLLTATDAVPLDNAALAALPARLRGSIAAEGRLYLARQGTGPSSAPQPPSPGSPQVGDIRVAFQVAPIGPVTVVGAQTGNTFAPWIAPTRDGILLASTGTRSPEAMFKAARDENALLTWTLRIVGVVLMVFGILLVLGPIGAIASFLPLVGDLLGVASFVAALAVGLPLALLTIATAWLFYRPLLGLGLVALAAAAFFGLRAAHLSVRKRPAAARAAAPSAFALSAVPAGPPSISGVLPQAASASRFCASCGTPVAAGSGFCGSCGASVGAALR